MPPEEWELRGDAAPHRAKQPRASARTRRDPGRVPREPAVQAAMTLQSVREPTMREPPAADRRPEEVFHRPFAAMRFRPQHAQEFPALRLLRDEDRAAAPPDAPRNSAAAR